jgi:hypothetical protein
LAHVNLLVSSLILAVVDNSKGIKNKFIDSLLSIHVLISTPFFYAWLIAPFLLLFASSDSWLPSLFPKSLENRLIFRNFGDIDTRSFVDSVLAISAGASVFGINLCGIGIICNLDSFDKHSFAERCTSAMRFVFVNILGALVGIWCVIASKVLFNLDFKSNTDCLIIISEFGLVIGLVQSIALKLKIFSSPFLTMTCMIGAFLGYFIPFVTMDKLISYTEIKILLGMIIFVSIISIPIARHNSNSIKH